MKNLKLISIALLLTLTTISCEKQYQCECTLKSGETTTVNGYGRTKDKAAKGCESDGDLIVFCVVE